MALLELPHRRTQAEITFGFGLPSTLSLVSRMEQGFLRQLQPLPPDTRRLLLAAAVEPVGDAILLWGAAERLGIGADAAAPAEAAGLIELIEAAVRSGEFRVAGDAFERLTETTGAAGTEWALGVESRSRALLGSGDADELYRQSIDHLGRTGMKVDLARADLLYGEWLRREGRRTDARGHLRTAHDQFTAMGAEGFGERARRELVATGETARTRAPDAREELTAQETEIARLAALRRTNQEIGAQLFLSPRTVEWHLRKVFMKLGVSSRKELYDALPEEVRVSVPG